MVNKLKNENEEFIIKSIEVSYIYPKNNLENEENTLREEKIIFIGTKESYKELNYQKNDEYFIDITFKAVPQKYRPYKLITITALEFTSKTTKLACMRSIIYMDSESYKYAFRFLNENYKFNPKLVHIDFEDALANALLIKSLFKKPPLLIKSMFHFSKAIKSNIQKKNLLCSKKLNKKCLEILRNLEIFFIYKSETFKKI